MKPIAYLGMLLLMIACPFLSEAQVSSSGQGKVPNTIFDALSTNRPGEGIITIYQPIAIKAAVGKVSSRLGSLIGADGNIRLVQGYRVQVYNGNVSSSKREASRRASEIAQLYPDLHCDLTYRAPFWRLLVGEFSSREEAEHAEKELKESFPSYAREIYIVRDKIRQSY